MKRNLFSGVLAGLSFFLLIALPAPSGAVSIRSASSRSYRSSTPPVTVFVSAPAAPTSGTAAEEDYAYGSLDDAGKVAIIRLRVLENAQVWIDGNATSQTGTSRPFVTPALDPGKDYSYEIRARWTDDGRTVEQTRKITVQSGDRMTVNLTRSR